MSKTYFNYSFQIKRTKTVAIVVAVILAIAIFIFYNWYNNKTVTQKVENLSYKVVFGMNEFDAVDCVKAYRMNYKKNTCGTICINKTDLNKNYLNDLRKNMEQNDFIFTKDKEQKLGRKTWNYIKTKNNEPVFSYYTANTKDATYIIEYVDQQKYLDTDSIEHCTKIWDDFKKSIKLND